jgi:hypothetical protein
MIAIIIRWLPENQDFNLDQQNPIESEKLSAAQFEKLPCTGLYSGRFEIVLQS